MAWLLLGADSRRWSAADWIVRNAFDLMLPSLLTTAPAVARKCADATSNRNRVIDLSVLLADSRNAEAWRIAVRHALHCVRAEQDEKWYEPSLRPAFETSLSALEAIARPDGNELIAELASSFGIADQNIFGDPPFIRHQMC